ncbi:MAG: hypothetical protein ACRDKI_05540 [Solirubrobacterales bacterium]
MKARLGTSIFACALCAWIIAAGAPAGAAVPVSAINSCDTAVAALNASLTTLSRSQIDLKKAKRSHRASTIKRAKQRVAAATAQRDLVRSKIRSLCTNGVSASAGGCSAAIDKLAVAIDALAVARKGGKGQATIAKLERQVNRLTEAMRVACTTPPVVQAPQQQPTPPVAPPDLTPPVVTIGVKSPTNDTTPAVALSANEQNVSFSCAIDGGAYSMRPASFDLPVLSETAHTLSCTGTDAANNTGSPTVKSVAIDVTAPGLASVGGPTNASAQQQLNFLVILIYGSGESAECKVDAGAFTSTIAGTFLVTLPVGVHMISCRLVDAAGNTGPTVPFGPVVVV